MFKGRHFYNKSIRSYVVLFGTLFNEMLIQRANQDSTFKVPLTYQMKEKFIANLMNRNGVNGEPGTPELEIILPRMSYYMVKPIYDNARKINTQQYGMNVVVDDQGNKTYQKQLAPVPYTFAFDLSVYTRYEDDMLQIIEQILPYFQPHFNAKIKEASVTGVVDRDIMINLVDVEPAEQVVGLMIDGRRIVQWDLKFELYGYLYPQVQEAKLIKRTIVNFVGEVKDLLDEEAAMFRVTDEVDPWTAGKDDPWTVKETQEYPHEGT
jgi:hypothetical protein